MLPHVCPAVFKSCRGGTSGQHCWLPRNRTEKSFRIQKHVLHAFHGDSVTML